MMETFQNEIIVLVVILIGIIIYFLIKKKKPSKTIQAIKKIEVSDIKEEIEIKEPEPEKVIKPTPTQNINFDGNEEGSFDIEDKPRKKIEKAKIKKRDVPPHGKINKQNFKEFAGLRVLVAEDNIINQKVVVGLLADTGIEIVLADDGQEAIEILEKDSNFKIVIMDAHMPRMDGFEATRAIRENSKLNHIVVVALSGDTAVDDIRKMSEAGMEEHLEKPLKMDALYDILYAYTGKEEVIDDTFIHVLNTKELNGDKGLEICGGDEEFYREILNEFIQSYENSTDKLQTLLNENRLQEADRLLLDIIGVTANIGADNLNKIATKIKDALKDTTEKSYLTLSVQYKEHLSELLKDIK